MNEKKPDETPDNPEPLDLDFESLEPGALGETEAFVVPPEEGTPGTGGSALGADAFTEMPAPGDSGLGPDAFTETPAPLGDLDDSAAPQGEAPEGDTFGSDAAGSEAFGGGALADEALSEESVVGEAEEPTGRKGRVKKARKGKARKDDGEEGGSALASLGAKLQSVNPYTWMLLFSLIAILISTGLLVGELASYKYDMKAKEMRSGVSARR